MSPDDLLTVADNLVKGRSDQPNQVELRRAVSTAYYALFHELGNNCADLLVGLRSSTQTNQAWRQAYRALDHREVRRKCTRGPGKPILDGQFPSGIQDFAKQFVKMQATRHKADYDPFEAFTRSGVEQLIRESRTAVEDFRSAAERDRRAFAVFVLFPIRRD